MTPPIHSLLTSMLYRLVLLTAVLGLCASHSWAQEPAAATIYKEMCARCHGAHGQGVPDGYKKPLHGTHTVAELAELIAETMPEEAPEDCIGEEARQVAEFIHERFYSQGNPRAPRLTRLTVDQYRNAVADIIGSFTSNPGSTSNRRADWRQAATTRSESPTVPGLRGEYYQSRGMSKTDALGQYRNDTRIDFDFGEGSPAETITPDQFSIIWQGGFLANDTGHYDFRVSTQNGVRLYVNLDPRRGGGRRRGTSSNGQQALIDEWVSSGEMREHTSRIFLLGGRTYAIRLEFFKYLEKTASVKLEWKPPHGTWSVLDYNDTSTIRPPRVYVCKTPFPADDRSLGYERGSSVSSQWQVATTNAAVEAAEEVVARLPLLARLTEDPDDTAARDGQIKDFVLRFARAAYRRPLTSTEEEDLAAAALADAENLEAGVRRAVVTILMSPYFLYTDLTPPSQLPTPYAIASRLSLGLWDSIPDQLLLDAAGRGDLTTEQQIEAQARRMMADPRAKAKMRSFFRSWLELEERDLAKDKQMFPDFDEAVIADLRRSLESFIERVVWSPESDYRQLLLADYLVLNDRLRDLYPSKYVEREEQAGRAIKRRAGRIHFASSFQPVQYPAAERSGVLTHPYLLSAYAYHNNTSPIHRGVFLTRNIVGRALNPPPIAVAFKNDEFAPDLTMREKVTQLTRDTACMACHSVINPLGFTLENFDAVGRWRTTDNNKPVDTKSQYTTATGEKVDVANARDVAEFAVSSESAHRAFITHVFQHVVKQSPVDFDPDLSAQLTSQFAEDQFNIRKLWVRIASVAAAHTHAENTATSEEVTP